ncbi:MAG: hypothetical protein R6X29_03070, partial [Acidimicrobiia bacterium]
RIDAEDAEAEYREERQVIETAVPVIPGAETESVEPTEVPEVGAEPAAAEPVAEVEPIDRPKDEEE